MLHYIRAVAGNEPCEAREQRQEAQRMLEIVFHDSAKAMLMIAAKNSGIPMEKLDAGLERISENVAGLSLMLEIGDISGTISGRSRKDVIWSLYGHAFDGPEDEAFRGFLRAIDEDMERVREAAGRGEPLRIWHSAAPGAACGLRHVLWEIRDCDCPVWEVALPEMCVADANTVLRFSDWSEVEPEELGRFLPNARRMENPVRRALAMEWSQLAQENMPLRAQVNGRLIGVPEDFYDMLLRRCMPEGEFRMANWIGNVLGRYPVGIGDCWYAHRIRTMIASGELVVVKEGDGDHPYSATLRRR